MGVKIPLHRLHWKRSWRIIPTRYPERHVYDRITDSKNYAALQAVERLTNPRVKAEQQAFGLRPGDRFPRGAAAYNVVAAFASPAQSRFGNGHYGVYYAADSLLTAISETRYHREAFMRQTASPPMSLKMRVLVADLQGTFHDLRGRPPALARVYHRSDYSASQKLALHLWKEGSEGLVYDSVRHNGGQCAAVFSPQTISHCRRERSLQYEWDGKRIVRIYEIREFVA